VADELKTRLSARTDIWTQLDIVNISKAKRPQQELKHHALIIE
jgi:hypothetical protein